MSKTMQAHLASVLKHVVKDKSKGALSRLLGERAAASRLLERIEDGATWHARIGIVLVDDARLRSYTPRGVGGRSSTRRIWVWSAPEAARGSASSRARSWTPEAYVPGPRCSTATRRLAEALVAAPLRPQGHGDGGRDAAPAAGQGRGLDDRGLQGHEGALKKDVLSSDSVASSPFGVDVGPDAILASLGAYHATYEPADVMIQDVVVGSGDDQCINQIITARRPSCEGPQLTD